MDRKKFNKDRTLIVFLLTVVVFFLGISVGTLFNIQKLDQVAQLSKELQQKSLALEVEYDILEENICNNKDVLSLTDELFDISEKASYMENMYGYDDPRIIDLKSYYFTLEAKHWLLAKKRVDICGTDLNFTPMNSSTILYFYSNENDCPRCDEQGSVLSYLRRENSNLKVYSFDVNYNLSIVSVLKSLYDISDVPAVVLNDEAYVGFIGVDDLIYLANMQVNNTNITTSINSSNVTVES